MSKVSSPNKDKAGAAKGGGPESTGCLGGLFQRKSKRTTAQIHPANPYTTPVDPSTLSESTIVLVFLLLHQLQRVDPSYYESVLRIQWADIPDTTFRSICYQCGFSESSFMKRDESKFLERLKVFCVSSLPESKEAVYENLALAIGKLQRLFDNLSGHPAGCLCGCEINSNQTATIRTVLMEGRAGLAANEAKILHDILINTAQGAIFEAHFDETHFYPPILLSKLDLFDASYRIHVKELQFSFLTKSRFRGDVGPPSFGFKDSALSDWVKWMVHIGTQLAGVNTNIKPFFLESLPKNLPSSFKTDSWMVIKSLSYLHDFLLPLTGAAGFVTLEFLNTALHGRMLEIYATGNAAIGSVLPTAPTLEACLEPVSKIPSKLVGFSDIERLVAKIAEVLPKIEQTAEALGWLPPGGTTGIKLSEGASAPLQLWNVHNRPASIPLLQFQVMRAEYISYHIQKFLSPCFDLVVKQKKMPFSLDRFCQLLGFDFADYSDTLRSIFQVYDRPLNQSINLDSSIQVSQILAVVNKVIRRIHQKRIQSKATSRLSLEASQTLSKPPVLLVLETALSFGHELLHKEPQIPTAEFKNSLWSCVQEMRATLQPQAAAFGPLSFLEMDEELKFLEASAASEFSTVCCSDSFDLSQWWRTPKEILSWIEHRLEKLRTDVHDPQPVSYMMDEDWMHMLTTASKELYKRSATDLTMLKFYREVVAGFKRGDLDAVLDIGDQIWEAQAQESQRQSLVRDQAPAGRAAAAEPALPKLSESKGAATEASKVSYSVEQLEGTRKTEARSTVTGSAGNLRKSVKGRPPAVAKMLDEEELVRAPSLGQDNILPTLQGSFYKSQVDNAGKQPSPWSLSSSSSSVRVPSKDDKVAKGPAAHFEDEDLVRSPSIGQSNINLWAPKAPVPKTVDPKPDEDGELVRAASVGQSNISLWGTVGPGSGPPAASKVIEATPVKPFQSSDDITSGPARKDERQSTSTLSSLSPSVFQLQSGDSGNSTKAGEPNIESFNKSTMSTNLGDGGGSISSILKSSNTLQNGEGSANSLEQIISEVEQTKF